MPPLILMHLTVHQNIHTITENLLHLLIYNAQTFVLVWVMKIHSNSAKLDICLLCCVLAFNEELEKAQ